MSIDTIKAKPVVTPDSNPGNPAYLKIRDLIYRISGIYHSEGKLYLLISRCARRMIALGVANPRSTWSTLLRTETATRSCGCC